MNAPNITSRYAAFSLVEIAITLAIIATVLVAALALLSLGFQSARLSTLSTTTGIILEDVHQRLGGMPIGESSQSLSYGPYFYDRNALFITDDTPGSDALARRLYRAEISILPISPENAPPVHSGSSPLGQPALQALRAVNIQLFYPVNPTSGLAPDPDAPATSITYYLTTLTGPNWQIVDPSYTPKIEF
jgi:uncharacterized protein (TIGR02598 family)